MKKILIITTSLLLLLSCSLLNDDPYGDFLKDISSKIYWNGNNIIFLRQYCQYKYDGHSYSIIGYTVNSLDAQNDQLVSDTIEILPWDLLSAYIFTSITNDKLVIEKIENSELNNIYYINSNNIELISDSIIRDKRFLCLSNDSSYICEIYWDTMGYFNKYADSIVKFYTKDIKDIAVNWDIGKAAIINDTKLFIYDTYNHSLDSIDLSEEGYNDWIFKYTQLVRWKSDTIIVRANPEITGKIIKVNETGEILNIDNWKYFTQNDYGDYIVTKLGNWNKLYLKIYNINDELIDSFIIDDELPPKSSTT